MPGMQRPAALLALAASVAAIAGCGSNDVKGTIPPSSAAQLNADLDAVESSTASGDCETAQASAQDFVSDVNLLPSTAGSELKDTLRGAGENLRTLVEQCQAGVTGATGEQPTIPERSSTKHTSTDTAPTEPTTTEPTTTPPEPEGPPGDGNANGTGNENGNGQGNGTSGVGNPGAGNPGAGGSTGGTGGTGGTGIGGN
jgi:hypothetical protein